MKKGMKSTEFIKNVFFIPHLTQEVIDNFFKVFRGKSTALKFSKATIKILILMLPMLCAEQVFAFCGFYVTKADASLFNKSSQVIIARNGEKTTITMSNDFSGDVKDFAMVVPVPVLLKEEDIKVVQHTIFDQFDAYSGPRLVQYYDHHPCQPTYRKKDWPMMLESVAITDKSMSVKEEEAEKFNVTIEAKYTIGEYDIMILSAKESNGLKEWLLQNDYKIPEQAEEVLQPYIKSRMKFFVAKVNLDKQQQKGFATLSPLQISFHSWRFGLPIRLGMANAESTQDLIIYLLTEKGRVEVSNYRNVKIPTNINVPEFVEQEFPQYYKSLFETSYLNKNRKSVFLEYAWDISSHNPVKCDPCPQMQPIFQHHILSNAGVDWIDKTNGWANNYRGNVFFTRLHVRYDRQNFPQDLTFIETPNKESFQGRYVIQRAVGDDLTCPEALGYYKEVKKRREKELIQLEKDTDWNAQDYAFYIDEIGAKVRREEHRLGRNIQKGAVSFIGSLGGQLFLTALLLIILFSRALLPRWIALFRGRGNRF